MNMQMSIDFQETRRYSIYNHSPSPLPPLLSHHTEDLIVFVIDLVDYTSVTHRPCILHATQQKLMLCKSCQKCSRLSIPFFYFLPVNFTYRGS